MYGFCESSCNEMTGDLELGTGGYSASRAHDVAVSLNSNPGLDVSPPATAEDLEAGDSLQRSEHLHQHARVEHPNGNGGVPVSGSSNHGGFAIGLNDLVEVVNLEALDRYDGVWGLSVLLKTDLKSGIDQCDDEILQRRQIFGSNTYPFQKGIRFWGFIWKATQTLPSLLMMLAALINSLLRINRKAIHDGLYIETCIISAIVLDILVRAITEYRLSRQFAKLREEQRNVRQEKVIRGGIRVSVSTNDIVVGDIIPLKNGVQVPADGILFRAKSLMINERGRSGSHITVQKDPIHDPFLFSGSKVIEGIATMLVIRVGENTRLGEITHETDDEKPFQVYLNWLANSASLLAVSFASVACIVQLCRYLYGRTKRTDGTTTDNEASEFVIKSLSFGIRTVVVALPVGFPTAVLLNLAITRRKMMSENVLVQSHSACETMIAVTTIVCHQNVISTLNQDPHRLSTSDAIQQCKSGGVKVSMVTNEDVLTAKEIATECGILWGASEDIAKAITTGAHFRHLTDQERNDTARDISVLAEASPRDILLYVKALKSIGKTVAVVGMGIHDTETLRAADVSLAMGIGGTAAAKENSHIIILDDSFATILKAIQCCRSLYTNIQKYVQFWLTVSVSTVAICVVEVVCYDAFPVNVVQLLLLNLIVDIFGALALAYRPTASHLMGKPPVGRSDPLITKTMWSKLVIQVIYLVLSVAVIHSDSILKLKHGNTGNAEQVKNTFIFNSLIFFLLFSDFEIRSADQTIKEIFTDNMFLAIITASIIFQMIVIQFLGIFISAVRLDLKKWVMSALVGFFRLMAEASS